MADGEYDNEMRGVLFKIPEDKMSKNGPVMRGQCQIEGATYRMSVWGNKSQKGTRYWSIKFQVDDGDEKSSGKKSSGKPSSGAKQASQRPLRDTEETYDDIPFE